MGMVVEKTDAENNLIVAAAPGPAPLSKEEWDAIESEEIEGMRAVVDSKLGAGSGSMYGLRMADNRVYFVVGAIPSGAEKSLVHLYLEVHEPIYQPGVHPFKMPPPLFTSVSIAKFWTNFDEQIEKRQAPSRFEKTVPPIDRKLPKLGQEV
jgi:hypothetical protein